MRSTGKIARIGSGCLLGAVIAIPLACFILTRLLYQVTGEPFFDNRRDRAKLQRIAEPYEIVIRAIGKHRASHGAYPAGLNDLDANLADAHDAKAFLGRESHTVYYHADGDEFTFHVKLNWDGGLNYHSRSGNWRYDPGNGDPDWPIRDATPE
jgi:hypothetical protein